MSNMKIGDTGKCYFESQDICLVVFVSKTFIIVPLYIFWGYTIVTHHLVVSSAGLTCHVIVTVYRDAES